MKRLFPCVLVVLCALSLAFGDSGVLIPRDKNEPDPAILSLDEMEITITVDNGVARVFIRQIFANHTNRIEEGNYLFALASRATVSDFAVWDGPTRIPAVILERKRASELYNEVKQQMIDPGLLQMGERGADEARRNAVFSARIVPIAPYATKRLEIEYHENVAVENLKSFLAVPLHPDSGHAQVVGHMRIAFELHSAHAVSDVHFSGAPYTMTIVDRDTHSVKAGFEGQHVALTEDFAVQYALDPANADKLGVITHRDPDSGQPDAAASSPDRSQNEPGFFEAQLLIGSGRAQTASAAPHNVIILFDNSLSMQWDKLERSYSAMEQVLRSLHTTDSFTLLLFNNSVTPFQPAPIAASRENIQKALDFVRGSRLRGGTNLEQALTSALAQCGNSHHGDNYLLILSDGGATRGTIHSGRLAKSYGERWKQLAEVDRPRTYVFAVGDDANLPLLRMISRNEGAFENVLSTEPIDFKLNAFISKIGRTPVAQLGFSTAPDTAVQMVYPLQDSAFAGGMASWVGQYSRPSTQTRMTVRGVRDGVPLQISESVELPGKSLEHPQLPRLWARARVDALLEKIERDGEDAKTVDEIIRLSRKYKFVTPYTSFLAVPRALLRPRVIRPGDPVLRVHTDQSIKSVIAIFPFGLTKRLRYLDSEDVWQTRFLAPEDLNDGTYSVRLVLRDNAGHTYRESKTFVIASKPPVVNIRLERTRYHRGDTIPLRVSASASTRSLMARMDGASPVPLRWNAQAGANTGELRVPTDLPSGTYHLTVIAEDIAHNAGTQEVQLEVLP